MRTEYTDIELIGKKIYKVSHYGIGGIVGVIDKVTKTQISVGGKRFNRETLNPIGYVGGSVIDYYKLETPEINDAWAVKGALEMISNNLRGALQNCSRLEERLSLSDVKKAAILLNIQI